MIIATISRLLSHVHIVFSIPFRTSIFSPCQRLWGSWQGAGFPQCIEGNSKPLGCSSLTPPKSRKTHRLNSFGKRWNLQTATPKCSGICCSSQYSGCSRCMSSGLVFHFGFQLSQLSPWSDHLWTRNALTHPGGGIPGPCDRQPNTALLDRCGLRPSPGAEKLVGGRFWRRLCWKGRDPKKTWEQWHFPLHSAWEVRESEPSRWFRLDSDPKEHLFVALLVPISSTQSPVSLRSVNGVWRDNIHSCPCKTNNSQLLRRTRHCQTKSNSIPTWPVKR